MATAAGARSRPFISGRITSVIRRGRGCPELDILPDQPPEQGLGFKHHRIQIQHLGLEHLPSAESQKLAGQRRRPVRGLLDLLQTFAK